MGKLVLIFVLANLTYNHSNVNVADNQAEELQEYVYWKTFSETFTETADFWEAESAALEAEDIAEDRTGVEEWMEENKDNILDIESQECLSEKC